MVSPPEPLVAMHLVLDCADPERLAEFWSALLGVEVEQRWHQYVMLTAPATGGPAMAFQQVPEPKRAKNRMHLDFPVADLAVAGARVLALGGAKTGEMSQDGVTVHVMTDPEGNEFCLVSLPSA